MPTPDISYPLINGHRYSFASIEALFGGIPITGISAINYKSELKAGTVRGTAPQKLGRTRGDQDASCDFEMYKLEWELLKARLSAGGTLGFGETAFDIVVVYAELPNAPFVTTDVIRGVRVEETELSNAQGTDATKVKVTCSCMDVIQGGASIATSNKIGL